MDRNYAAATAGSEIEVVPYVGTWIEIIWLDIDVSGSDVVPYVGTWIEIDVPSVLHNAQ